MHSLTRIYEESSSQSPSLKELRLNLQSMQKSGMQRSCPCSLNLRKKAYDENRSEQLGDQTVDDIVKELRQVVDQLQRLSGAFAELQETRRQLTTASALEEQTVAVVRRLNDKWRENTDAVSRLHESVENLNAFSINMKKSFDMLYNQLIDIIHCPIPGVERRSQLERRHDAPRNDTAERGGEGAQ